AKQQEGRRRASPRSARSWPTWWTAAVAAIDWVDLVEGLEFGQLVGALGRGALGERFPGPFSMRSTVGLCRSLVPPLGHRRITTEFDVFYVPRSTFVVLQVNMITSRCGYPVMLPGFILSYFNAPIEDAGA